jgi:hypothetical protein
MTKTKNSGVIEAVKLGALFLAAGVGTVAAGAGMASMHYRSSIRPLENESASLARNGDFDRAAQCDRLKEKQPDAQCPPALAQSRQAVQEHRNKVIMTNAGASMLPVLSGMSGAL